MMLIKYKENNYIEGYVKNEQEFKFWLSEHNKKRVLEGHNTENKLEFSLIKIKNLMEVD